MDKLLNNGHRGRLYVRRTRSTAWSGDGLALSTSILPRSLAPTLVSRDRAGRRAGVAFDRVDLAGRRKILAGRRATDGAHRDPVVMLARATGRRVTRRKRRWSSPRQGVVRSRRLGDPLPRVRGPSRRCDVPHSRSAARGSSSSRGAGAPSAPRPSSAAVRRGSSSPAFSGSAEPEDDAVSVARVRDSGAQVLFVAYGMPKQERWIARNLAALPAVRLAIGVGGVFDQLAGVQKVPPSVLHAIGLEWLWRLAREPRRWRRQRVLPLFALLVLRKRAFGR